MASKRTLTSFAQRAVFSLEETAWKSLLPSRLIGTETLVLHKVFGRLRPKIKGIDCVELERAIRWSLGETMKSNRSQRHGKRNYPLAEKISNLWRIGSQNKGNLVLGENRLEQRMPARIVLVERRVR